MKPNQQTEEAIHGFQIGKSHSNPEVVEHLISSLGNWIATWKEILESGGEIHEPDRCAIPTYEFILLMQEIYRLRNEVAALRTRASA